MSTAAPTPLPTMAVVTDNAGSSTVPAPDSSADTAVHTSPATAATPFCLSSLASKLSVYASSSFCAAILFAGITYAMVHFLGTKLPVHTLKLYAAGGFALLMYGLAALKDKDPMVATKGFQLLSTSQLPLLKRLLAAWYLTFPALAAIASVPKALTPATMVLAADAAMIAISYADQQGLLSKYM